MNENEKLEAVELTDEALEEAKGGYGNVKNMRNSGYNVVPGCCYMDSITRRYFYLVKTGDTFTTIANRFNMPVQRLKLLNPHIPNINRIWDYDVVYYT